MFLGLRTAVYQVQDLNKAKDWYRRGNPGRNNSRPVRKHSGRDPESEFQNRSELSTSTLGHDDAGSLFRRLRGKRKADAQEIEECSGARPAVGLLLADAQQKNQQVKNI